VEEMKMRTKLPLPITLVILAFFVFVPMLSALEFSLKTSVKSRHSFENYLWAFRQPEFLHYIVRSGWLSALTVVISLVLLVPLITWLHISNSKIRPIVDALSLMPLIIPVVAFAIGAQVSMPMFVQDTVLEIPFLYAMIALPYTYRSLDIGMSAYPIKILTEAARSTGADWVSTIRFVVLPVIRASVLAATALCFALSLGEFTLTSLLHWDTFPTWINDISQGNVIGAIALSMLSLVIPFLALAAFSIFMPEKNTTRSVD
jgi:putative spermidine/putrescine transport system permease protein